MELVIFRVILPWTNTDMLSIALDILQAAVLLFWACRIFLKKDAGKVQLLMAAGMLTAAYALGTSGHGLLFIFPFFFLSLREITVKGGIPKWDWLVFIPSLVFSVFEGSVAFDVFLCIQAVSLSAWASISVRRYNKLMEEYYDAGNDASDNLGQVALFLAATAIVLVVIIVLPDNVMEYLPVSVSLSLFLTVILFIFGLNVFKLAKPNVIPSEQPEPVSEQQPSSSGQVKDADRLLLQKIVDEKLFLDPMISLVSLAEDLHTNRTYLSNTIHTLYNQNFSEFINHLRIEYALELMRAGKSDINIKEVAMRSGYNHLQSFYRNFAQIMDMTPKTWMANNN